MKIILGDCIEEMKKLEENSVDAVITDPPYGIGFMGKEWDNFNPMAIEKAVNKDPRFKVGIASMRKSSFAGQYDLSLNANQKFQLWFEQVSKECLRVLKPGGFLLSFGGTRTYHRMVCGIEDAGFEIRDTIMWLYGSGFPKSLNIGKQIDKMGAKDISWFGKWLRSWREENNITQREIAKLFPSKTGGLTGCVANWELGLNIPTPEQFTKICRTFDLPFESIEEAEREVVGKKQTNLTVMQKIGETNTSGEVDITIPATKEAKEWEGWGTALKPACEPIVVARKPLSEKNVALNVLKHGTGGINIDASRISLEGERQPSGSAKRVFKSNQYTDKKIYGDNKVTPEQGRFPANIILDEEAGKLLDEQSGDLSVGNYNKRPLREINNWMPKQKQIVEKSDFNDKGGASRFFYCAKASKSERMLEGYITVKLKKDKLLNKLWQEESTALVQLLKKVTSEWGITSFSIEESGENIMAQFHKDSLSTIRTIISKIIELKTLNLLQHLPIKDYIQIANLEMENGGKIVHFVKSGKLLQKSSGISQEKGGYAIIDVENAILELLLRIKESEGEQSYSNHPTHKPIKLMEYLIKLVSREGATILDPFLGSGTTGIAATKLNKKFIGIEKEEEYVKIAKARIKPFLEQTKLSH